MLTWSNLILDLSETLQLFLLYYPFSSLFQLDIFLLLKLSVIKISLNLQEYIN